MAGNRLRWMPRSLEARIGLSVGVLLTLLWVAAASVTSVVLRRGMDEVFDSALQETAQRILPLAVVDIVGREEDGVTQRLAAIRVHDEYFTYVIRDEEGHILLQSHAADAANFPAWDGPGFRQTATHRLFNDAALRGTVRITVAEPLDHRASIAREIQIGLGLPLLIVIPLALGVIVLAVRSGIAPLRRFRARLEARDARDLSPVPTGDLPAEVAPLAMTLNALLARLKAAFDAERSFAANAAHELRTPLAGAIAQAQRLQRETADSAARHRAAEIEASLKRLARMSERLLQLARAEGGPLRLERLTDLRDVARIVLADLGRAAGSGRIVASLPPEPVLSDLDPDAFGILCRNLVENAQRHGTAGTPIGVTLERDGLFRVTNESPLIPPAQLTRLTARFERGVTAGDEAAGAGQHSQGSGLGLAIVAAITERISTRLVLASPRPGSATGFSASVQLPVVQP